MNATGENQPSHSANLRRIPQGIGAAIAMDNRNVPVEHEQQQGQPTDRGSNPNCDPKEQRTAGPSSSLSSESHNSWLLYEASRAARREMLDSVIRDVLELTNEEDRTSLGFYQGRTRRN